jgi:hypothetical protein
MVMGEGSFHRLREPAENVVDLMEEKFVSWGTASNQVLKVHDKSWNCISKVQGVIYN